MTPARSDGRVNLLILASSLWIGGAETVIRHLANNVTRDRFRVAVCYLKQRGQIGLELERAGIEIFGLAPPDSNNVDYLTFLKLLRVIRSRGIEVVHSHTTHGLVDASMCKLFQPGLRLVHTFHFGNYPHTRPRILVMERICSRLADRLCAVGDAQREQLLRVHRLPASSVETVWNGVPSGEGAGDPSFRLRVDAEGRLLIGTIATLIEQKGLRDLLDVAREVRDRRPGVRFVIVGEGRLRQELEARVRELGLDGTVTLTGWVTNAAELALPHFDIFYQPSLWEAMSVVVLEAMAARKPVVATRVGENAHVVEDGVTGFLVAPRDIEGMTVALLQLIDNRALRVQFGAAAARAVECRFSVQRMTAAYERLYLDTLRRREP